MHLYEDLVADNRSPKLIEAAIKRKDSVLNVQNAGAASRPAGATGRSGRSFRAKPDRRRRLPRGARADRNR